MPEIVTVYRTRQVPPVFVRYSLEEIAQASGYSLAYVTDMFNRPAQITPLFRLKVSYQLGQDPQELFENYGLEPVARYQPKGQRARP